MPNVARDRFGSKKTPVEPTWLKELMPLAEAAGKHCDKTIGHPAVIAFKNKARRCKEYGHLVSWEVEHKGTSNVYAVSWVAKDKQWSRRV